MKKILALTIIFFIILSFTLSNTASAQKTRIGLVSGESGGTFYAVGSVIATLWNEKLKDKVNASSSSSAGSTENFNMFMKKEAEVGIIISNVGYFAYRGIAMYKDKPYKDFRMMAILYGNPSQIVVTEKSGIKKLDDLKGKRVSVGTRGSGLEGHSKAFFDGMGMSYNDFDVKYLSYVEAADAMKNGLLDAAKLSGGLPVPAITDLYASPIKVRLLEYSDAEAERITKKFPFFAPYTIPADTYPNQKNPVKLVAQTAQLMVRADIPEGLVYELTKCMFDNLDYLYRGHSSLKELKLSTATIGLIAPLHPGAYKFYQEKGIKIPAESVPPR